MSDDLIQWILTEGHRTANAAELCPRPLVALGSHPVRGLGEPADVFGLPVSPEL